MLRRDLAAAGIPYATDGPEGLQYLDFHAFWLSPPSASPTCCQIIPARAERPFTSPAQTEGHRIWRVSLVQPLYKSLILDAIG
jgi:hypothetical protein